MQWCGSLRLTGLHSNSIPSMIAFGPVQGLCAVFEAVLQQGFMQRNAMHTPGSYPACSALNMNECMLSAFLMQPASWWSEFTFYSLRIASLWFSFASFWDPPPHCSFWTLFYYHTWLNSTSMKSSNYTRFVWISTFYPRFFLWQSMTLQCLGR